MYVSNDIYGVFDISELCFVFVADSRFYAAMYNREFDVCVSCRQIKISDTKCEDIKEIIESSEDDELFRELLEEQKQKREQFEKERKELEGKKGKKKKKKKSDL